jgi:hypothetical protein
MDIGRSETVPVAANTPVVRSVRVFVVTALLGFLLAAWLVVQLPAFLCMGPEVDPNMYDVVARRVLKGDVHYQDLLETNFPGIVWVHMAVHTLFGWSTVTLRVVDVALVGLSVGLLMSWLPRSIPARGRIGVAAVLFAFYFSTTEWCHCQRDIWMLPVCLVGLGLRCRQVERLTGRDRSCRLFPWAVLEGAVWATACWIKPFAFVPGLTCWLITARHATIAPGTGRRLAADLAGLLAGGLAVGGLGAAWLVATGAWHPFLDVMFGWNREYFASDRSGGSTTLTVLTFAYRFFPWFLVHLVAVQLAMKALLARRGSGTVQSLRGGFYLAWLLQSFLLQHFFDYVQVPAVLLGVVILAAEAGEKMNRLGGWLIILFLVLCTTWRGVGLTTDRAAVWAECVRDGSTPAAKYRTSLLRSIHWEDLDRAADFLRRQGVRDGEVTCFTASTISLYNDLDVRPSTRFLLLDIHLDIFVSRRDEILTSLAQSRQKYLVCDVSRGEMKPLAEVLDGDAVSGPQAALKERLVFRSGDIVVFRLDGADVAKWLDLLLG